MGGMACSRRNHFGCDPADERGFNVPKTGTLNEQDTYKFLAQHWRRNARTRIMGRDPLDIQRKVWKISGDRLEDVLAVAERIDVSVTVNDGEPIGPFLVETFKLQEDVEEYGLKTTHSVKDLLTFQ